MSWTDPRTWQVGEIVTKVIMDLHIKDNFRYLKGIDGVVTIQSGLIVDNTLGTEYLTIPSLTTTQRDALTPTAGMVIYNTTTTQFNKYENGAWRADLGYNSAHANLSGLTNDEHTQYQKESLLTTAGDLPYATAASTWARLGIGTAGQFLKTNAGATAPEWATGPVPTGFIGIWAGTIANIPTGYVICDGNNSTPNLLAKFIEGVATAATNPGTTGGATNKTTAGHTHTNTVGGDYIITPTGSAGSATGGLTQNGGYFYVKAQTMDTKTDSIADIRPLYYDIAFIMKT